MTKTHLKVLALGAILTVLSGTQAFAEHDGKGKGFPSPERRTEKLKEKLSLSDDQAKQIQAILEKSKAEGMDRAKQHHEDVQAQIDAVLTPEQKAKFSEIKAEQKEKRDDRKEGKRDGKKKHRDSDND